MSKITTCEQMIQYAFSNIEKEAFEKNNKFAGVWKKILTSIKSYDDKEVTLGQNLYDHSTVIDVKNGILLVETDHPGWSQMLQMKSKYILRGLQMYVPELKIESLAFRIKGSNATLHETNYDSQLVKENEKMNEKMKKEEEILKKYEKKDENLPAKDELPAELLDKFNSIKQSMLTNIKNK